jgi:hypothetical protein
LWDALFDTSCGCNPRPFSDLARHHCLDAVGVALVARAVVRGTQLGKLFGWQVVAHHDRDDATFSES